MKVYCMGDSLTEGDYGVYQMTGIGNVQPLNYPHFLAQITGFDVTNLGKCGFTSSTYLKLYKHGRVSAKGADIVIIMLGTNGGMSKSEETQGNRDMRELISLCMKDAPQARIILCTPPHATEDRNMSNYGFADNVENAAVFIRRLAKELNLDIIDTLCYPEFTHETEHIMQPNDGLHFTETGYRTLAENIARDLMAILEK